MSEEIKAKFDKIKHLSHVLHMKVLYSFMQSQYGKWKDSAKLFSVNFEDESEVKMYLLDCLVYDKSQYSKIIKIKTDLDIYEEIYDAINREFPVFPFTWEEYEFRKLMEKTFCEKKPYNKINANYPNYKLKNNIKKYY